MADQSPACNEVPVRLGSSGAGAAGAVFEVPELVELIVARLPTPCLQRGGYYDTVLRQQPRLACAQVNHLLRRAVLALPCEASVGEGPDGERRLGQLAALLRGRTVHTLRLRLPHACGAALQREVAALLAHPGLRCLRLACGNAELEWLVDGLGPHLGALHLECLAAGGPRSAYGPTWLVAHKALAGLSTLDVDAGEGRQADLDALKLPQLQRLRLRNCWGPGKATLPALQELALEFEPTLRANAQLALSAWALPALTALTLCSLFTREGVHHAPLPALRRLSLVGGSRLKDVEAFAPCLTHLELLDYQGADGGDPLRLGTLPRTLASLTVGCNVPVPGVTWAEIARAEALTALSFTKRALSRHAPAFWPVDYVDHVASALWGLPKLRSVDMLVQYAAPPAAQALRGLEGLLEARGCTCRFELPQADVVPEGHRGRGLPVEPWWPGPLAGAWA